MADHRASFSAVQVLPGTGTVVRYGDVLLWWEPGPTAPTDLPVRLVELVKELAAEGEGAAAAAGGRLAAVLREVDAQAVTSLTLVLPSPTGLRVVVHGLGRVVAPGVDLVRGWEDRELPWPDSLAFGHGDGGLRPPTPGSPYDLVEGGTPGAGAAVALVARSVDLTPEPAAVPSIAAPEIAAPVQPPKEPPTPVDEPTTVPPMEPTILQGATGPVSGQGDVFVPSVPAPSGPGGAGDESSLPVVTGPIGTGPVGPGPVGVPDVPQDPWAAPTAPIDLGGPAEPWSAPPPQAPPTAPWTAEPPPDPVAADAPTLAFAPAPAMPGPPTFAGASAAPPRPPEAVYGAVILDDGSIWPLDGDYVIGTAPGSSPDVAAGRLRAIPVVDPSGQAHAVHAEIRHGEGGTLLLVARATTYVLAAGSTAWQPAPLDVGLPLDAGVRVSVGQRTFSLAAPY